MAVDYYDLQKLLKASRERLTNEEKLFLKINGFTLKGNYNQLVDSYRLLHNNIKSPFKHFRHKLLMTTKNPIDEVTEMMLEMAIADMAHKDFLAQSSEF
jgi:hypothetical protein